MAIRLKLVREELGLSQVGLARLTTTIHPSSISQIETGHKAGFKQRYFIEKALKEAGWNGEGDLFEEVTE